jgi:hypothetical protein
MSALDTQVGGSHYRNGGIQPVQFIEANKLQYLEASVVKRVTRHNQKGGKGRQDIEKAIHELQLLLELRYPVDPPTEAGLEEEHFTESITVPVTLGVGTRCLVCLEPGGHSGLGCPKMRVNAGPGHVYTQ